MSGVEKLTGQFIRDIFLMENYKVYVIQIYGMCVIFMK